MLRTLLANADDDLTTGALFREKAKAAPLQTIRAAPTDTGNFILERLVVYFNETRQVWQERSASMEIDGWRR